ncbi:MAG: Gfo/Idh/MocA family oxidoreductase, partial [Bryobacteraceae bacterium]|nr:Gfo/Idh/MocA family oxidoreductase [Bryobacteraceae bacterium]
MERRDFLAGAAITAAPMFLPSSARGANDRISYGLIAAGGRGRYINSVFQKLNAECVALCDVYEPNLEAARKQSPQAKTFVDYNDLLSETMDAVVIASPDHHHAPMLFAALKAKRDVYLEKPLSKSLEESLQIIDGVKRSSQVVQIGMQRRSAESIMKAKQMMDEGLLGQVTLVKPQWHWNVSKELNNSPLPGKLDWDRFTGNAKKRDLEPMRFRNWRYFFDYAGGNMTDQGTHLMDVVQWFMKSGPPLSAVAQGYVAKMKGSEHPDVFSAIFEFPTFMATWTLDYANSFQNGWSITFMGDKGTMILDEFGYTVYTEPWKPSSQPIAHVEAPVPVESHIQNFMDCMRSRQTPNCPPEIAAAAVAGPHLANLAMFGHKQAKLPDGYLRS